MPTDRIKLALQFYYHERALSKYHTARSAWRVAYYMARLYERGYVFTADGWRYIGTVRMVTCSHTLI